MVGKKRDNESVDEKNSIRYRQVLNNVLAITHSGHGFSDRSFPDVVECNVTTDGDTKVRRR